MNILGKDLAFWVKCAIVAATFSYAGYYFDMLVNLNPESARNGASVLSQLSGTMLGFVLAALAILTTLGNSTLVANMQQTGHFPMLLKRMFGSVMAFGLVTLSGAILLFVPQVQINWIYPLVGVSIFSVILLIDVFRKLWVVLEAL